MGEEKTPAAGREAELSRKNWKTLRAYFEYRISPRPVDAVARKNFGIVAACMDEHDRLQTRLMILLLGKQ
jgi:hypothetical protein